MHDVPCLHSHDSPLLLLLVLLPPGNPCFLADLARAGTPRAKTVVMLADDDAKMDDDEADDVRFLPRCNALSAVIPHPIMPRIIRLHLQGKAYKCRVLFCGME